MTLHEEVAVGIAHGYAKAAERPMGVALHNLVGLQHASMAIFNAYCDNVPMLVVGGAVSDTTRRRPWIDSVHTPNFQNLAARDIVKWDAEPRSLAAVPDAFVRGYRVAMTQPQGPTYVAVDVLHQEGPAGDVVPGVVDTRVPSTYSAPLELLEEFAELLVAAERPVVVTDNVGRSRVGFDALIELAELLAVPVVDLQARHNFPNTHWADGTPAKAELLGEADVVLVLDPRELALAIGESDHDQHGWNRLAAPGAQILVIGLNDLGHRGFIDKELMVRDARVAGATPRSRCRRSSAPSRSGSGTAASAASCWPVQQRLRAAASRVQDAEGSRISPDRLVSEVGAAVQPTGPWQLVFPSFRGIARRTWDMSQYAAHLGGSGGAGLAYGPSATVGAALARRDDETLVVGLQPDGDLLYAPRRCGPRRTMSSRCSWWSRTTAAMAPTGCTRPGSGGSGSARRPTTRSRSASTSRTPRSTSPGSPEPRGCARGRWDSVPASRRHSRRRFPSSAANGNPA